MVHCLLSKPKNLDQTRGLELQKLHPQNSCASILKFSQAGESFGSHTVNNKTGLTLTKPAIPPKIAVRFFYP
jgi:hypothetical protein